MLYKTSTHCIAIHTSYSLSVILYNSSSINIGNMKIYTMESPMALRLEVRMQRSAGNCGTGSRARAKPRAQRPLTRCAVVVVVRIMLPFQFHLLHIFIKKKFLLRRARIVRSLCSHANSLCQRRPPPWTRFTPVPYRRGLLPQPRVRNPPRPVTYCIRHISAHLLFMRRLVLQICVICPNLSQCLI